MGISWQGSSSCSFPDAWCLRSHNMALAFQKTPGDLLVFSILGYPEEIDSSTNDRMPQQCKNVLLSSLFFFFLTWDATSSFGPDLGWVFLPHIIQLRKSLTSRPSCLSFSWFQMQSDCQMRLVITLGIPFEEGFPGCLCTVSLTQLWNYILGHLHNMVVPAVAGNKVTKQKLKF